MPESLVESLEAPREVEQTVQQLESILSDSESSECEDAEVEDVRVLARREVDAYMRVRRTPQSSDPLAFWRMNKKSYPILSVLARAYLCPPSSSTASEREFKVGKLIQKDRVSLLPRNLETLLFLKYNLRATNYPNPTSLPCIPADFIAPNANVYNNANMEDEELEDEVY